MYGVFKKARPHNPCASGTPIVLNLSARSDGDTLQI